jgi:hypothetical protein
MENEEIVILLGFYKKIEEFKENEKSHLEDCNNELSDDDDYIILVNVESLIIYANSFESSSNLMDSNVTEAKCTNKVYKIIFSFILFSFLSRRCINKVDIFIKIYI